MIVIDAGALTDFLLGRPAALGAVLNELDGREHEALHGPELIEPETLNALRGLMRGGKITTERAGEAVTDLASIRLNRYPHAPLRSRVWELRDKLTAYDASYLALAEALDGSILIAGDAALVAHAVDSLGQERVRSVS
ncbi:MAG: type II toxin-antitoxin system VapC family toxin [Solirubrobacteraceae bacterium]